MTRIGIIATTHSMIQAAVRVVAETGLEGEADIRMAVGSMEYGLAAARELAAAGAEVIVTRGGTGELIRRSELDLPLVEIPIGPAEFIAAVEEARRLTGKQSPRMAVMAFRNTSYAMEVFARLSGISVQVYEIIIDDDSFDAIIGRAIADGVEVMMGGHASTELAIRRGLRGVVLETSDASMRSALQEAQRAAVSRRLDVARTRRTQMLLDLFPDGVVDVDENGMVRLANPSACRLLGISASIQGQPVEAALPFVDLSPCLKRGEPLVDELRQFGGSSLVVGAWPIRVADGVAGALVSLREADDIRKLEAKISGESFAKGLVAGHSFADIAGDSPPMGEAMARAKVYAATNGTILVTGETGTGKELFAQSIHNTSPCRQGPFVAVNCAALPPALLESELFGYEEGAFTGAVRKGKPGLFELANNGTIFLDEISEMDRYGQTRLLRVLQEKRNMRLGGGRYVQLNVRVIAASNRCLRDLIRRGEFRQDLYYRLTALTLHLPPLRERHGDIPLLAERFALAFLGRRARPPHFTDDALAYLSEYPWPGNVRELQNLVERLCLFYRNAAFGRDFVRRELEHDAWRPPGEPVAAPASLSERERIVQALRDAKGNQRQAAKALHINPSTLYRKMRHHDIQKNIL